MKKKLLLVLLMATILVTAFTGCKLFDVTATLEFVNAPQTEYTKIESSGDSLSYLNFTARMVSASQTLVLDYQENKESFEVKDFDLASVGTRTATVTYTGQNVSVTFTYTVTEPESLTDLTGEGTAKEPYKINSANDFVKMVNNYYNEADKNYELTADIDFAGVDMQAYVKAMSDNNFNFTGTLNGNGYTIYNLTVPGLDGKEDGEQLQMGLFYRIAPAEDQTVTIKNLKFQNCSITNSSAAGVGILGFGDYPEKSGDYVYTVGIGTVVIDNVDMYNCHVSAMKNSSLYIGYAAARNFYFTNCDVDAYSSVTTTSHSSATFIGSGSYINPTKATGANNVSIVVDPSAAGVSFDNCTSAATLTGASGVHGFLGNYSGKTGGANNYTAKRSNGSRFTGTIYTMTNESDSASILPGVSNTSNDSYIVNYAGDTLSGTTRVGYTAKKSISKIELVYNAGELITIDTESGVTTYVFSYAFARGGSTYGNSESVAAGEAVDGKVSSKLIKYYTAIYDYADTTQYPTDVENALMVYGPLNTNIPDVEKMPITFSVFGLDKDDQVVAFGSVKETGITYITAPETAE